MMPFYGNIRIKIRLTINDTTHQDFVRYISVSDSSTVGDLMDDINTRLEQDNMNGDIYYVFDEQLDNPFTEDSLLGGPLFPRNILLVYTMIENNTTLFVQARLRNSIQTNIIRVIGRIYIEETGERLNDMLLNIPYGTTIGTVVDYINGELGRQFLAGNTYHINGGEEYQISDQTLLGGTIYSPDRLITDMGIGNNSVLYMNCRITNPLFLNLNGPPQLPIINIDDQAQLMDLNSFLDVYDTLMNMGVNNVAPLQQNILNDAINNLNNLQSLVNILAAPVFTNVELLNPQNMNRRMEDIVVALDKDDLDKLRVSIYTDFKNHDREMCSVCFEKFIDSDICRELKCNHLYHKNCIDKWLGEHITCPVCREECGKGVPQL
jgi:hypothetical protein